MKVVIVGGVAGGASAAARLRRLDEKAEIIMLERSGYVSYANCGLPYYIGGEIKEAEKLTVQTPESLQSRFAIDVRIRQEAVRIDRKAKTVQVRRLEDGTLYTQAYDKLILAPGARPIVPPLPGVEGPLLFTLRTVEDTLRIRRFVDEKAPRTATVIGGGFIGLEMAESLRNRGLEVTVVQLTDQVLPTLDGDMAALVHEQLRRHGVTLRLNTAATGFERREGRIATFIQDDTPIVSDFVILAAGVAPESALAKEAGLALGLRGAIRTDAHMRTSDPDIYAVGDAVEVSHLVTGQPALIALAGPANKQGRIAADNICGIASEYRGSQGSNVLKVFTMTVGGTGLTARQAQEAGIACDYALLSPPSHATYYPGAANMTLKVVFEKPSGRILGAQAVGGEGVDKRVDVLSAAIRAGMTGMDLAELELAYAPPYSSAKDPVNMAGFIIENLLTGKVRQVHWRQALCPPEGTVLLDTRTDGEYRSGHIPGALHLPLDELRQRLSELPQGKTFYVYCQSGLRSYLACRILMQNGIACYNVAGGYGFYSHGAFAAQSAVGGCGLCR